MDRLRDLLVKARLVTEAQVREAEKMGGEHHATLAHVLVRGGVIDTQKLAIFLSKKLRIEYAALSERELSPNVLNQIPLAVAQRLRVIPIALRKTSAGEEIVIAMSDPTDASAKREVEHVVNKRVMALVTDEVGLQRAINKWYQRAPVPGASPPPAAGARPPQEPTPAFQPLPTTPSRATPPQMRPTPPAASPSPPSPPRYASISQPPVAAPSPPSPAPARTPSPALSPPPTSPPASTRGAKAVLQVSPPNQFSPPPEPPEPSPYGGHQMSAPLHGITLDGYDDEDDAPLQLQGESRPDGIVMGDSLSREANPAAFLTESTMDVARMYAGQNETPPKASPLDAILEAPPPPAELDSHPDTPHLKNSRVNAKAAEDFGGPGDFLTPNTEEHMALLNGPGAFGQDLSLDEDTAWLRQRLRGEQQQKSKDDDRQLKEKNAPDPQGAPEQEEAPSPAERSPPPPRPPRRQRPSTTPGDFLGDSSLPSATTPSPPRVMSAPTTREVGTPKRPAPEKAAEQRPKPPARPRRPRPPKEERVEQAAPAEPALDPQEQAPRLGSGDAMPTAAYVLDEPTRMDLEGKIGAGATYDVPSLPSDDAVAAAFDANVELPPRLATDVALAGPASKATLPSDSGAIALSSEGFDDGPTDLVESPLAKGIEISGRRRPAGDDGPTRIVDYDAERRERELRNREKKRAAADREDSTGRSREDVAAELKRLRGAAKTKVVDVSSHSASPDLEDEQQAEIRHQEQPTVVVELESVSRNESTQVTSPLESNSNADLSVPDESDDKTEMPPAFDGEPSAEGLEGATRITEPPKRREEKTVAVYATVDDPPTQLDISLSQMTMCIVCSNPRLRVALGRALRKSVATLYLEENLPSAVKLGQRIDVDVLALIDPVADGDPNSVSDTLDQVQHRHHDRPLIVVVTPVGQSLRVRRAHLRVERPDDDERLPESITDGVAQMLDV